MNRWKLAIEAIAMNGRRSAILSLLLGFTGTITVAACAGDEQELPSPSLTGRKPEPVGRVPLPPAPPSAPPSDAAPECAAEVEKPCMRYLIPIVGNPETDLALRAAYIAAFGTACYMSEANTFDCYYKPIKKACADAVRIGEVSGNAAYDPGYVCQAVGNGDYTLQIGPDSANKLVIYLEDSPRQTPLIDINGVPTAVNGPYRNLPEPKQVGVGEPFGDKQRARLLQVNKGAHSGEIHSDLAGFEYPCDGPSKPMCKEPLVLQVARQYDDDAAQVHHVIRRQDKRCCAWGTNSNLNAAVISRKLNIWLTNDNPTAGEVALINQISSYTP